METKLRQFIAECRTILTSEPGPSGRRKICMRLEEVLRDPAFIAETLSESTPERQVLHEDPQLHFCLLAHSYKSAKDSRPHDHGPSWAIYGQAKGETEMTDYERIAPPAGGKPGQARPVRTYKLTPGAAYLYNEGDLHSPLRRGPTQLIRIEGVNMDRVQRDKYEVTR
jgi:predicted metal-dependent enzyme (double-stranded beta helix superfamily)